jgi:hypothetical protein
VEAARRIRSIAPDIPIVFFTANGRERMPNLWSELASGCVEKSEDFGELKRLCASLLGPSDAGLDQDGVADGESRSPVRFDSMEGGQNANPHASSK